MFMLYFCISIALVAISYPFITRRVPPNGWCGFRTPRTLSDPKIWYDANCYSGKTLLAVGLIELATVLITHLLMPVPAMQWLTWAVVLVTALIVSALLTWQYTKSL